MLLSLVIPTYHSSKFIEKTLCEIESFSKEIDFRLELVIVDDGSLDGTYEKIVDFSERSLLTFKVLQLFRNRGQFQALMAGLSRATGDYVITMDDDLEYHPREIPKLLNRMKEEPELDVVIGYSELRQSSLLRKVGSKCFQIFSSLTTSKKKDLKSTCFRILTKEYKEKLLEYRYFEPVLGPLIFSSTRRIANVLVKHNKGLRKSNYTLMGLIKLFSRSVQGFSGEPIKYMGMFGLFLSFFSMLVVFGLVTQHMTGFPYPIKSPGWASLIVSIWFLAGVMLLAISVIGQYVYLNRLEILRAPNYQLRSFYENNLEKHPFVGKKKEEKAFESFF